MLIALILAVPAALTFVWAANPPADYGSNPKENVTIEYDAEGKRTGHAISTDQIKKERDLPESP